MSNQKPAISDDGMTWLIIISGLFIVGIVLGMIITANLPEENCWDKYPNNEVQAILNCEGKE
jgi:uncharacterized membrane-anchored protein YhcB (DUF1043 family)